MNEEKKKQLRNHMPTIKRLCDIFLGCLDCPEGMDPEVEKNYLLEIIDKIEIEVDAAKAIVES